MISTEYIGTELGVFANAVNWKAYFRSKLKAYIRGDVLEVGAGLGGTTRALCDGTQRSWLCLEPDPGLAHQLDNELQRLGTSIQPTIKVGAVVDLEPDQTFDCILYIDVLEHIEDDAAELERVSAHLRPGGAIIVLSPAHNYLFSEFDRAIGHFRRYDMEMIKSLHPSDLVLHRAFYLDSVGMIASLANRWLLRSGTPNISQIKFWDRALVPCSTIMDRLTSCRVGKTIVGIWKHDKN